MAGTKKRIIKSLGYSLDELSETEAELIRAIEGLDGDTDAAIRLARIIRNKFQYCRSAVRAQNLLEELGAIEVI